MKYIDLTRLIREEMPVYPNTEKPKLTRIEIDGWRETLFSMFSHTGTHMDAPYHIYKDGKRLEEFEIEAFTGVAVIIDVPAGSRYITPEVLGDCLKTEADFVLLRTGWGERWGCEDYFHGFPVLSPEAAKLLADLRLKGIGIDAISVDEVGSADLPIHKILLRNKTVIIENLARLEELPEKVSFTALPLKYEDADGSPVRAFACF